MMPPAADTVTALASWIAQSLAAHPGIAGLAGTRVYRDLAPVETTFPYVIFSFRQLFPRYGVERRLGEESEWLVKLVSRGHADVPAVDTFFAAALTTGPGFLPRDAIWIQRAWLIESIFYTEPGEQESYIHRGGLYRVLSVARAP